MRVRLTELLAERGMTVYALAKAVERRGGVSEQAVYRLARNSAPERVDVRLLDAICDVLDVGPGELLERGKRKR